MPVTQMFPRELQSLMDALRLTQQQTGWIFANRGRDLLSGERRVRRWVSGDSDIPNAVAVALRLMHEHKIDPHRRFADVLKEGQKQFRQSRMPKPKKELKNGRSIKDRVDRQHVQSRDRLSARERRV